MLISRISSAQKRKWRPSGRISRKHAASFSICVLQTPVSQERGFLSFAFLYSEIATDLSSTPCVIHGERSRMHVGFAPQKGLTTGSYVSAFKITHGRWLLPAPEARDIPTVFLINTWSELPPEALALQIARKAAIIAEGDISDASLIQTHWLPLSDEIMWRYGSVKSLTKMVPANSTQISSLGALNLRKMKTTHLRWRWNSL